MHFGPRREKNLRGTRCYRRRCGREVTRLGRVDGRGPWRVDRRGPWSGDRGGVDRAAWEVERSEERSERSEPAPPYAVRSTQHEARTVSLKPCGSPPAPPRG